MGGGKDGKYGRRGVSCAFCESQVVFGWRALGVMELCQPTNLLMRGPGASWYLWLLLVLELSTPGTQSFATLFLLR